MLFTIIDIETTSLSRESEILEVGYMQINHDLNIIRHGNLYFYKPEFPVETSAQEIHGLTREFLEQHETMFNGNIVRLYTLFQNSLLVGKNSNAFDVPTIKNFLGRHAPELGWVNPKGLLDMQKIYTKKYRDWYHKTYGETTRKCGTLSELVELIGYTPETVLEGFKRDLGSCEGREQAHSALYDVYMTYLLLKESVESGEVQIINKTGKSNEELRWEETKKNIDEMLEVAINNQTLDASKYLMCMSDCFEHYEIVGTSVDYMIPNFVQFLQLMLTDKLAKAVSDMNSGTRGFSRVEDTYSIDTRTLSYWLTTIYLKTSDDVFMKLMKILLRYCNFIPERILNYDEEKLDLNQESRNNSVVRTYVDYNTFKETKWGIKPAVDINSSEILMLFKTDRIAFWKKAIPNTNVLFAELCCGMISWEASSIYGMFILLNERGGI